MSKFVYLDYQATTPVDPLVLERMLPFFSQDFANPAGISHGAGRGAAQAVAEAREQVAAAIGAHPLNLVFTSGATESINTALKGAAAYYGDRKRHLVTCKAEHSAVLGCCDFLAKQGWQITYLDLDARGHIDLQQLEDSMGPDTQMVSLMWANNETGVLLDVEAVGRLCKQRDVFFHCDATQAVGKVPVDVERAQVDLLSFSAHKLYGPKGIGALYVRPKKPRVRLQPLLHGGGQERGFRAGTSNVPGIVGFGAALALAQACMEQDAAEARRLRQLFLRIWCDQGLAFQCNGDHLQQLPGCLNVRLPGVLAERLMHRLDDVAIARGSACTAAVPKPSHVLLAMGLDYVAAQESVRICLGRPTSEKEVCYAANRIAECAKWVLAHPQDSDNDPEQCGF